MVLQIGSISTFWCHWIDKPILILVNWGAWIVGWVLWNINVVLFDFIIYFIWWWFLFRADNSFFFFHVKPSCFFNSSNTLLLISLKNGFYPGTHYCYFNLEVQFQIILATILLSKLYRCWKCSKPFQVASSDVCLQCFSIISNWSQASWHGNNS